MIENEFETKITFQRIFFYPIIKSNRSNLQSFQQYGSLLLIWCEDSQDKDEVREREVVVLNNERI